MQNTTPMTLDSRHVRRVVTFVLWRVVAVDVIGERELSDGYYDRAWSEINPIYMLDQVAGHAEFLLVRVAAISAAVRSVAAAADGDQIELPVSPAEVADALRDCLRAIDLNDDLFLQLPADQREDVLKCRRAAIRLLRTVGGRAALADQPTGAGLAPSSDPAAPGTGPPRVSESAAQDAESVSAARAAAPRSSPDALWAAIVAS